MVERIKRVLSIADRKVSAQLRRSKPVVRDRFDYEIGKPEAPGRGKSFTASSGHA
jgi:hypothetical protein